MKKGGEIMIDTIIMLKFVTGFNEYDTEDFFNFCGKKIRDIINGSVISSYVCKIYLYEILHPPQPCSN